MTTPTPARRGPSTTEQNNKAQAVCIIQSARVDVAGEHFAKTCFAHGNPMETKCAASMRDGSESQSGSARPLTRQLFDNHLQPSNATQAMYIIQSARIDGAGGHSAKTGFALGNPIEYTWFHMRDGTQRQSGILPHGQAMSEALGAPAACAGRGANRVRDSSVGTTSLIKNNICTP